MPADFYVDAQLGVVFSKATGALTLAEAEDHMDRLQSHPDFRPGFNQLFDFREVGAIGLSHEDVCQLATRAIFSSESRRAFVVIGDLPFGLARVFEAYRELKGESGIRVFRKMEEALAWLSLPAAPDVKLFTRLS